MSGIELWVFIGAAACVGIYHAVQSDEDDVVVRRRAATRGWAWTARLTARKPHK